MVLVVQAPADPTPPELEDDTGDLTADRADGLPQPRRAYALLAIWAAMAMSILDISMVTLALPDIARDLNVSAARSIWVVNAYQIAIIMTVLTAASAGDRFGYRRIYVGGLVGFMAGSLLCVFASSLSILALGRFAQGLGAAWIMGVNGALIRFTYPRASLARGIGLNTMIVATASASGPSIAGVVLSLADWRTLFVINLPLCLLAILVGWRTLPEGHREGSRIDIVSALLCAIMFAGLFLGLLSLAHDTSGLLMACEFAFGGVAGFFLLRRSRRQQSPLIPLDLLRISLLRLSYAASSLAFAAMMIFTVAAPFFLRAHLGFDLLSTGLLLTPLPLAVAVTAPLAGRLVERVPAGLLGAVGLGTTATSIFSLSFGQAGISALTVAFALAICGVGYGLFQTPNNQVILGTGPLGRTGSAAGMQVVARLTGQTSGAVLVTGAFAQFGESSPAPLLLGAGLAAMAAFASGWRLRRHD